MAAVVVEGQRARSDIEVEVLAHSFAKEVVARLLRQKSALLAGSILLALVLSSIAAPLLTHADPVRGTVSQRLEPIGSAGHILGTDEQGRDMLTRILYGGRTSLMTGFLPVALALIVGTTFGASAGYVGGWYAMILLRVLDMFYAFPALLLAIAISAALGPGTRSVILATIVVFIAPIARVALASTRQEVVKEYIEAARLSGASTVQIIRYQLLPNIFSSVFVYASGLLGLSILITAGLSFLGLGARPPTPEWGYMLNSLRGSVYVQPWVVAIPGFFILAASMCSNLLSDALNEALNIRNV